MKRDVADFWNLLWELALLACAGFALLNVFAPAQDLPWKPLDLSRPIGAATASKVSAFDLPRVAQTEEVERSTAACMTLLREACGSNARRTATTAASASCRAQCGSPAAM